MAKEFMEKIDRRLISFVVYSKYFTLRERRERSEIMPIQT